MSEVDMTPEPPPDGVGLGDEDLAAPRGADEVGLEEMQDASETSGAGVGAGAGVHAGAGADAGVHADADAGPAVAEAVARLDSLAELPASEHVEIYEDIHRTLQDALADAARDPDRSGAGGSRP